MPLAIILDEQFAKKHPNIQKLISGFTWIPHDKQEVILFFLRVFVHTNDKIIFNAEFIL